MTDVLDTRPEPDASTFDAMVRDLHERPKPEPPTTMPVDWLLGALLVGAGAIHLALAPTHIAEKTALGWGFLLAGWAQVGAAVLVVAVPRRWTRGLAAAVSIVTLAAWVMSRTSGLPFGLLPHAESIQVVDAVSATLEALAAFLAVRLLIAPRTEQRRWATFAAVVATLAIVGATAAIASPSATAHNHGVDDLGFSTLENGQMAGGHTHSHDTSAAAQAAVTPMSPATRQELARQLAITAGLVQKYPTIADAEKAGYWRAGPFAPGLGVHYNPPTYGVDTDGKLDDKEIGNPMLIYAGLGKDAPIAGFMYMSFTSDTPQGFAGTEDLWHGHTNVCMVKTAKGLDTPFGADASNITKEMCASKGGTLLATVGQMVHVWTVPGYESPMGTFSNLNPKLTCPDGTYHHIDVTQIGSKATTCLG
jgi:hypothetical protein